MEKIICVFGASSTWGAGDYDKGGWVNRLRLYIDKRIKEGGDYIELYNLGISGNTTRDILKRFESEMKARDPDLIILSIGDNDSALVPLEEFEKNIDKIAKLAKKQCNDVVFIGTKPVNEKLTTPVKWDKSLSYTNEKLREYNKKNREIAEKHNILFLDLSGVIDPEEDLEDGLHPNSKGHEKLYQKTKSFLEKNKLI